MTVYDNVGFALKRAKVPKQEFDALVRRAASLLERDGDLDREARPHG